MLVCVWLAHRRFPDHMAYPNPAFEHRHAEPLIERNPLLVWKGIALVLFLLNLVFIYLLTVSA